VARQRHAGGDLDLAEGDHFLRDERAAMRTFMTSPEVPSPRSTICCVAGRAARVYAERHARCAPFYRRSTRERRDVRSGRAYNRTRPILREHPGYARDPGASIVSAGVPPQQAQFPPPLTFGPHTVPGKRDRQSSAPCPCECCRRTSSCRSTRRTCQTLRRPSGPRAR
jgi:hypothetical protein